MEEFRNESWRVHPVLDVPGRFPPAVMFSIMDSDPLLKFKETVKKMSAAQPKDDAEAGSPDQFRLIKQGLLIAAWDSVFREVTGDRVSLVFNSPGDPGPDATRGEKPDIAVFDVVIGSTDLAGKKWVVTKATPFEERRVCWCKSVEVEKGKSIDVPLTAQDMIDLETL
jgi:hypothetical protein